MHYEYACIWDKCFDEKNTVCLIAESVMCDAGPVFFAMLAKDASFGKKAVGWFYEEGLPIAGNSGVKRMLANSYLRYVSSGPADDFILLLQKKNRYMIAAKGGEFASFVTESGRGNKKRPGYISGESAVILFGKVKNKEAVVLCTANFKDALTETGIIYVLKKYEKEDGRRIEARLEELKRRAVSRGVKNSMAAVYVRRNK